VWRRDKRAPRRGDDLSTPADRRSVAPHAALHRQCGMDDTSLITRTGGCHCGRVRFAFDAAAAPTVLDCNCTICRTTGFLHLIVPGTQFRLLQGDDVLVDYRFNTGTARHLFCGHCGIKSFYVPRSHPDGFSINARCVDALPLASLHVVPFDDGDREASMAALATHGL
jgi:hypothetical protein